jgi:hypothetical protein
LRYRAAKINRTIER